MNIQANIDEDIPQARGFTPQQVETRCILTQATLGLVHPSNVVMAVQNNTGRQLLTAMEEILEDNSLQYNSHGDINGATKGTETWVEALETILEERTYAKMVDSDGQDVDDAMYSSEEEDVEDILARQHDNRINPDLWVTRLSMLNLGFNGWHSHKFTIAWGNCSKCFQALPIGQLCVGCDEPSHRLYMVTHPMLWQRQQGDEPGTIPERLQYWLKPARPIFLAYMLKHEIPIIMDATHIGPLTGIVYYSDDNFYGHYRLVTLSACVMKIMQRNPSLANDERFAERVSYATGATSDAGLAHIRNVIRDNPYWFTPHQLEVQETVRQGCEVWNRLYPTVPDFDTEDEEEEEEEEDIVDTNVPN